MLPRTIGHSLLISTRSGETEGSTGPEKVSSVCAQKAVESVGDCTNRGATRLAQANGRPDLLLNGGYKRDVKIDTSMASVQFDLPLFNRNRAASLFSGRKQTLNGKIMP